MDRDERFDHKQRVRFRHIPEAVKGKRLLIRGTPEWEERERARLQAGCACISFGTVLDGRPLWQ